MVDIAGGKDISLCFIFLDFSYLAFILFQHAVHSHCSCNVWIFFRFPFGANVGDDQLYTELSKQTVVIENRGRVSHPEVAWTVLRLDLGERMLHMAKCDGGESGGGVGGWECFWRGGGRDRELWRRRSESKCIIMTPPCEFCGFPLTLCLISSLPYIRVNFSIWEFSVVLGKHSKKMGKFGEISWFGSLRNSSDTLVHQNPQFYLGNPDPPLKVLKPTISRESFWNHNIKKWPDIKSP